MAAQISSQREQQQDTGGLRIEKELNYPHQHLCSRAQEQVKLGGTKGEKK